MFEFIRPLITAVLHIIHSDTDLFACVIVTRAIKQQRKEKTFAFFSFFLTDVNWVHQLFTGAVSF